MFGGFIERMVGYIRRAESQRDLVSTFNKVCNSCICQNRIRSCDHCPIQAVFNEVAATIDRREVRQCC